MTKTPHPEGWPQEALSRFSDTVPEGMCQLCGDPVKAQGRREKRFCRDLCRTRFHYALRCARQAQLEHRLKEAGAAIRSAQGLTGAPPHHTDIPSTESTFVDASGQER